MFKGVYKLFLLLSLVFVISGCKDLPYGSCLPTSIASSASWTPTQISASSVLTNLVTGFANTVLQVTIGPIAGQSSNDLLSTIQSMFTTHSIADRDITKGLIYTMYINLTQNSTFQAIYYLGLITYIMFLGVSYAMGIAEISYGELYKHLLKIIVISAFTNPSLLNSSVSNDANTIIKAALQAGTIGWSIYYKFVVYPVLFSSEWLGKAVVASIYGVSIDQINTPFVAIDAVLSIFGLGVTWLKMLALLFSGSIAQGFILVLVVFLAIITLIIAVLQSALVYTSALIVQSILLAMGPFFIICSMFKYTQGIFETWYKAIIGLAVQQYIVFLSLTLFCVIAQVMIESLLYFEACEQPVISFHLMIPWPLFLKVLIEGLISAISWLVPISSPTNTPIFQVSIPLFSFYTASLVSSLTGAASVLLSPSSKLFAGLELFVFSLVMIDVNQKIPDFGKTITGSSVLASSFVQSQLGMLSMAHGKATSVVTGAAQAMVTGNAGFKTDHDTNAEGLFGLEGKFNSLRNAAGGAGNKGFAALGGTGAVGAVANKVNDSTLKLRGPRALQGAAEDAIKNKLGFGDAGSDIAHSSSDDRSGAKIIGDGASTDSATPTSTITSNPGIDGRTSVTIGDGASTDSATPTSTITSNPGIDGRTSVTGPQQPKVQISHTSGIGEADHAGGTDGEDESAGSSTRTTFGAPGAGGSFVPSGE